MIGEVSLDVSWHIASRFTFAGKRLSPTAHCASPPGKLRTLVKFEFSSGGFHTTVSHQPVLIATYLMTTASIANAAHFIPQAYLSRILPANPPTCHPPCERLLSSSRMAKRRNRLKSFVRLCSREWCVCDRYTPFSHRSTAISSRSFKTRC